MNGYSRYPIDTHLQCPHCGRYAVLREEDREPDWEVALCLACFGVAAWGAS